MERRSRRNAIAYASARMPQSSREPLELTRAAARALDETAQRRYGLPGIVLMENAARGLADLVASMTRPEGGTIGIVCGSGNNGGDGYAMARHLANRGFAVELTAVRPSRPGSDAFVNAETCRRMGIPFRAWADRARNTALLVDAIFGTGLDRPPAGPELEAIQAMNASGLPIVAVDLPSGVDNDAGEPLGESVRATATGVTVAPRPAMRLAPASGRFGRVTIIDIGSPAQLLLEFGVPIGTPPGVRPNQ